jgi:hypothetical protein
VERQGLAIQPPDLRDSQGGIDGKAVERAVGDVHLDGQVRRRIDAQVKAALAAHGRFVGDPVAAIRLQPAPPAPQGGRSSGLAGQAHFLGEGDDQAAQEIRVRLVLVQGTHDLQAPAVVSQADGRALGKGAEQAAVGPPIHTDQEQALVGDGSSRNRGHAASGVESPGTPCNRRAF